MTITDELRVVIEAEVERAVRDMQRWEKTVGSSDQKLEKIQKSMDAASRKLALFSGAMIGIGAAGIKAAAGFERQETELKVLLGSASEAEAMFGRLTDLSAQTPLQLGDVTKTAQDLLNYNVAASEVENTIRMLGDASRGNAAALGSVTQAYGRVQLKGRASMQELNMMTEAGIPILTELADKLDVTTEELFNMVSAGEVSSRDVQEAFIAMTSEGGRFHDMMKEVSETTEGRLSTAIDNLKLTLGDLAGEAMPMVNDILIQVTEWAKAFRELDDDTKKLIVRLIGIGAIAAPMLKVSSGAIGLYRNLSKLGPLMTKVGPALLSPWGALAIGIGGATAAVIALSNHTQKAMKIAEGGTTGDLENDLALVNKEIEKFEKDLRKSKQTLDAILLGGGIDFGIESSVQQFEEKLELLKYKRAEIIALIRSEGQQGQAEGWQYPEEAIEAPPVLPPEVPKKAWQAWFEEIAGIARESFGNSGREAGRLYVQRLQDEFELTRDIGAMLGEAVDPLPHLEDQRKEIKNTLKELFTIDPDDINDPFKAADATVQIMIAKYKELSEAIAAAKAEQEALAADKAMEERASALVETLKTPYDLMKEQIQEITDLQAAGHLSEQEALALIQNSWENYQALIAETNDEIRSFHDLIATSVSSSLMDGIDVLGMHIEMTREAADAYGELAAQLVNLGLETTLDSFKELGKAFEDGKISGEEFGQVMAKQAQAILNQLPLLFLQAGLQLIAQGQWALGLGFVFGGMAASFVSGYTEAVSGGSAEANALGNVFDQGRMVKAFAAGGAFTNSIVNAPTFFPMAAGGVGLMGEAGPEAIMPLTRGPGGELGVRAQGGAGSAVYVVINNYSGEDVQTNEKEDRNGERTIEVTIGGVVKGQMARGEYDGVLGGRYGVEPKGVRA